VKVYVHVTVLPETVGLTGSATPSYVSVKDPSRVTAAGELGKVTSMSSSVTAFDPLLVIFTVTRLVPPPPPRQLGDWPGLAVVAPKTIWFVTGWIEPREAMLPVSVCLIWVPLLM
jgi:hypothetical protein